MPEKEWGEEENEARLVNRESREFQEEEVKELALSKRRAIFPVEKKG